jgi:hypothetical protein
MRLLLIVEDISLSIYNNFRVEFIRRQTNVVAHRLTKAITYVVSLQVLVNIL